MLALVNSNHFSQYICNYSDNSLTSFWDLLITIIILLPSPLSSHLPFDLFTLISRGRTVLTIAANVPHPFGLAIYENKIYWTDWIENSVHRADKLTGNNSEVLFRDLDHRPMDIHVYHHNRTRGGKSLLIILHLVFCQVSL